MKVLQINTIYPNGSTGRIAAAIADYTAKQTDTEALVAFGIGETMQRNHLTAFRIGKPIERKIHGAIRKLFDAEGYGSRNATKQLIAICEENKVDIIHLHNLHGCYINLRLLFGYLAKKNKPVIWTFHDCWPMTGHCAHYQFVKCDKWKTQCSKCPQKSSYPVCIGLDGSKRNYRYKKRLFSKIAKLTIAAPCQWIADQIKSSFLSQASCRVIYNGVNTQIFKPVQSNLREQYAISQPYLALAVASVWNDRKGLGDVQKLAKLLGDQYRVAIIGLTKQQISELTSGILGIEKTESTDVLCAWYSEADCFINPTLEDTMPLVNLEALACGTPVATYRTGGCPEVIRDDCGCIAEQGNVEALAEEVRNICRSKTDYQDACIRQAERFNEKKTLQSYMDLYYEVMQ